MLCFTAKLKLPVELDAHISIWHYFQCNRLTTVLLSFFKADKNSYFTNFIQSEYLR